MFSFKRSLVGLVGVLLLASAIATLLPFVSRGQSGNPLLRDTRRSFYLTPTFHAGNQTLTACAEGYHMASLWEVLDTSNVRYNGELGFTHADSGFGPPTNVTGWIRTGAVANAFDSPGFANCNAWTSSSSMDSGTAVALTIDWDSSNVTVISPWLTGAVNCNSTSLRVWCMQD